MTHKTLRELILTDEATVNDLAQMEAERDAALVRVGVLEEQLKSEHALRCEVSERVLVASDLLHERWKSQSKHVSRQLASLHDRMSEQYSSTRAALAKGETL